ncbi:MULTISPECIES: helix-turn-helix domain-containing protein [unclassified Rhizobium]|uniref:helix-turn-helix domain-containing protein n=1 Tax=unclassified Rhizobium TaxID=2613769 RepID=UPI00177D5CE7|nr:helix-turn-helix transcriptional regulator [Rhizobium sp. CFBP 13644]MBD8692023.1 helix-turn-helix transcriptional regulator [Rhizobium sp. CFBP 13717]
MTYLHSMTCFTDGIRALGPAKWRGLDGLISVFWDAEGHAGATGYYLSPDPRIVIFFNDVSSHILMSNRHEGAAEHYRPMKRAIYVPAGVPLWTSFTSFHRFSHVDIHLHKDRMLKYLAPSVGTSVALSALRRPVEIQDAKAVETLASLLVDELSTPTKHAAYAESLVGSIIANLLDLQEGETDDQANARLTQAQMNKLISTVNTRADYRMTVSEMAETVGLSESWFANVFKQTTGKTPLQWQLSRRVGLAQNMLAESDLSVAAIAAQLGFSDQAHLTKTFRQVAGETPAAWRRMRRIG